MLAKYGANATGKLLQKTAWQCLLLLNIHVRTDPAILHQWDFSLSIIYYFSLELSLFHLQMTL